MSQEKLIDVAGGQYVRAVTLVSNTGTPYSAVAIPPSASTQTSVASSITSVTLLAANASRKGALIFNDSTAVLYLLLSSGTASDTVLSLKLAAGAVFALNNGEYTGIIVGAWVTAAGSARVTEFA